MPRKTDKRVRLIESAKKLIHQQGFNLTTLADIAQEADVPLGNVYYYFKTKNAIGIAVIETRAQEWAERLAMWSRETDPMTRLFHLIDYGMQDLEKKARFGCSVGGLCQELGKQGGPLADLAAKLLHDQLNWAEQQFRELGLQNRARDYALNFLSALQGAYLLTNTFKEPDLTVRESNAIKAWLQEIVGRAPASPSVTAMTEEAAIA